MDFIKNTKLRNELRTAAINAIWYSHKNVFEVSDKSKPTEPEHVASFIVKGLPLLNKYWGPALSREGVKLSLTGVFTHSYPRVEFTQNKLKAVVELADLLIVRRHFKQGKLEKETACLLQSKMSDNGSKKLPSGDPQHYLFTHWPTFQFQQKDYDKRSRSIGNIVGQGRYNLIADKYSFPEECFEWPDTCKWSIVRNLMSSMSSDASFASFLEDVFAFEDGREFFSDPRVGCEWSLLIQELLKVTFNKRLTARKFKAPKRGLNVGLMSFLRWFN